MLRSVVRLTFESLIISGKADTKCLNLITDVIRTRLFKGVCGTRVGDADGDDEDHLITFRTDFDTANQQERDDIMDEESDEENDVNVAFGDSHPEASDEEGPTTESVNEVEESDSSEEDSEEDEIDETAVKSVRDSVRQALGPAALNDQDLDSITFKEFNDKEMFARDDALIAAFRANRKTAPDRTAAEQARSLGQMKMRCLDLLACIVQHSVQSELLLPTLTVLLDIGRLAAECEAKSKQKHKTKDPYGRQSASFAARYGDLPLLNRILDIVKLLPTRAVHTQRDLCADISSDDSMIQVMQSVVTAAKLGKFTSDRALF
ncbi:unnamed protein product [Echinostoma caproni]|uniref:HECT domain-containing protein n=1 Tax=Echinostoma caproni TaxID=27848 RepID=A0A183AQL2_9TREM|nr:unnamed protein product [Echinostoma caproni]